MFPAVLLLVLFSICQASEKSENIAWPLFEFYNPMTWISPKHSSDAVLQIFKSDRLSDKKVYQELKKALLPGDLFIGNIREQFAAWDSVKETKSSGGPRRHKNKKLHKHSSVRGRKQK